ncbi:S4 domain-containing protein [Archaeoglobus neptunius]|uniref:S4 domain-containing protein n=1 Tax=Archaeoglobus neptunius TaxID=2798580 RepID=UPI001928F6D2|nr:S4 domain-containing protein [Archaeoglobus neptunius]
MRLDVLLVKKGYFSTRSKAKEAIRRGFVKVDGRVVTKPSTDADLNAKIEVLVDEKPKGYWKLKEIDNRFNLFSGNEVVLDLGSSAGGFLLYASERAKWVYGIEYSREFEEQLRTIEKSKNNVKVFIADAFTFNASVLPEFDLILNDLTLPFSSSMIALKNFLHNLKSTGYVLFVHKEGDGERADFQNLKVVDSFSSKNRRETYYLLRR